MNRRKQPWETCAVEKRAPRQWRRTEHTWKIYERDIGNDVEDISPKPARGFERRDEGFDDEQPQRLPRVVATFQSIIKSND